MLRKKTRIFVFSFIVHHQGCQARGAAGGARVDVPRHRHLHRSLRVRCFKCQVLIENQMPICLENLSSLIFACLTRHLNQNPHQMVSPLEASSASEHPRGSPNQKGIQEYKKVPHFFSLLVTPGQLDKQNSEIKNIEMSILLCIH